MKKLLLISGSALLIISCNNNKTENTKEAEQDSLETPLTRMVWQANQNDSTGRLEMVQVAAADPGDWAVPDIINYLNETNPEIILSHVKTSGDTIYLRIEDATYLTQRMGSSGPVSYLAGAVYNLTDRPGINYVNFDFEEGDHASPGTFTRATFKDD